MEIVPKPPSFGTIEKFVYIRSRNNDNDNDNEDENKDEDFLVPHPAFGKRNSFGKINLPLSQPTLIRVGPLEEGTMQDC